MRLLTYLICCPRATRGLRILCEREFARRCRRNRSTGPGVWCACPGSTIQQPEKYSKSSLCVSLRILNAKLGLKGVFNFVRFYERPYFFFFFFFWEIKYLFDLHEDRKFHPPSIFDAPGMRGKPISIHCLSVFLLNSQQRWEARKSPLVGPVGPPRISSRADSLRRRGDPCPHSGRGGRQRGI